MSDDAPDPTTQLRCLAEAVAAMRRLQRDYFRTRLQGTLNDCKIQERTVDALVQRVLHPPATPEPDLFG